MTLSIMAGCCYVECHLCWLSFMLSVVKYLDLYAECHYAECRYAECRGAVNDAESFEFKKYNFKLIYINCATATIQLSIKYF